MAVLRGATNRSNTAQVLPSRSQRYRQRRGSGNNPSRQLNDESDNRNQGKDGWGDAANSPPHEGAKEPGSISQEQRFDSSEGQVLGMTQDGQAHHNVPVGQNDLNVQQFSGRLEDTNFKEQNRPDSSEGGQDRSNIYSGNQRAQGFSNGGGQKDSQGQDQSGRQDSNGSQDQSQGNRPGQSSKQAQDEGIRKENEGQNQSQNQSQNQNQGKGQMNDQNQGQNQNQNGGQKSEQSSQTQSTSQVSTSDAATSTSTSPTASQTTTEPQSRPATASSSQISVAATATPPLLPPPPPPPSPPPPLPTPPRPFPTIRPASPSTNKSIATSISTPAPSTPTQPLSTETPNASPPPASAPTSSSSAPFPFADGPVAALNATTLPTSTTSAGNDVPAHSTAFVPSLSSGTIAGIAVGGVATVVIIAAVIVMLMKKRRRGAWLHPRLAFTCFGDRSNPKRGSLDQESQVGTSLVNTAAPIAGSITSYDTAEPVVEGNEGPTRPKDLAAYGSPVQNTIANVLGREERRQKGVNDQPRAPFATSALSLENDAASMAEATQINLVQQSQPASSSKCPFQIQKRLQEKQRPHNSTDPRPCRFASKHLDVDRGSVSTMSSHPSSRFPSRFSFGLLLSPALELFKFKDISPSLGGRGSGWSDWFKKEDSSTEKASGV